MKEMLKNLLARFSRFVLVRPVLKQSFVLLLNRFPLMKMRMKLILFPSGQGAPSNFWPRTTSDLSPRATQILYDLKKALGRD
jgi:hypothetical protein